jgi:putative flavoprotein involved in K+ transport
VDILVVGTGQAGLAMGYHLKQAGYRFHLVDRHARIGDSWRNRYDSLVLFTPRAYSALPGLPVQGDPDGYPTKVEIVDCDNAAYLVEHIAAQLDTCSSVQALEP